MAVLFPSVACLTLLHSCAGDCRADSLTAYMVFSIYIDQQCKPCWLRQHSMVCCLANKHGVQLKQCIMCGPQQIALPPQSSSVPSLILLHSLEFCMFSLSVCPPTSQKHASWWIGYSKLLLDVNVMCTVFLA